MKGMLAIDMGATSIRGILGYIEDGTLKTKEIMRFSHDRIKVNGRSHWDFDKIMKNIENTILEYGNDIGSIGVDTWGVDFGILDVCGNLIENPISYRDSKHLLGFNYAQEVTNLEDIFMNSGNQIMSINTLFQLLTLQREYNSEYKKIDKLLMMPDLINYFLCGKMYAEETITSTGQMYDIGKKEFSEEILNKFKIDKKIFPKIITQGEIIGSLKDSKIESLRKYDIPVISVASHDTASAILMTQAYENPEDTLFLSCGTWSLIGCITQKPVINQLAYRDNLTNEVGYKGSNMFFTNLTGLYLIEKLKTELEKKYNKKIDFKEITEFVENHQDINITFDVAKGIFGADEYDIIAEIDKEIGKKLDNDFDYFVVIYKSLVKKYEETIKKIEKITGRKFKKLHIIGGGAKSTILCQMIANATKLGVVVGPFEATAYGNIVIQAIALGTVPNLKTGLEVVARSEKLLEYKPEN